MLDYYQAREITGVVKGTLINVTVQGQRHLGAAIGSRKYVEEYVNNKVTNWISEITQLAEFSVTQLRVSYAVYAFGLKHRWTNFLRTLPDIQDLLEPLESVMSRTLISHLLSLLLQIGRRQCGQMDRDIQALPVRLGKIGRSKPFQ